MTANINAITMPTFSSSGDIRMEPSSARRGEPGVSSNARYMASMTAKAMPLLRRPRFSRGVRNMSSKLPMFCSLVSVSSSMASPRLASTVSVTTVMIAASTRDETNVKK